MHIRRFVNRFLAFITPVALLLPFGWGQQFTRLEREQRQAMLKTVYDDIRKDYYDPKFHGVDWEGKFAEAQEKVAKATSKTEANFQIAALLETLNDSHTTFIPPQHRIREDYGWQYQMIGDRCYVTRVKPGTDAEAQGLKPGDEVLTISGFTPTRESLDKMQYVLDVLYPQTGLRLELRGQSGKVRGVDVMATQKETAMILGRTEEDRWGLGIEGEQKQDRNRPRYEEFGNKLMILKLPEFFLTNSNVEDVIGKARKHSTLIVDLRGNPGGAQTTLQELLGGLFEQDVKIGDNVTRRKTTSVIAKGKHNKAFTGKLIVLADSKSASAAEIFAHVVQTEKRGTVLGDLTSGRVMAAVYHPHRFGENTVLFYGVMVSVADFVMTDGKSLEHVGVTPDAKMLPSKEDLLNHRDPVMARAAEMAGVALSPEKAAEMFPYEWPKP